MLEIIALIYLSRNIANTAEDKGHSHGLFRFLTFLCWFGFEFIGAVIGAIIMGSDGGAGIYLIALVSAGLGYLTIYLIAEFLPDNAIKEIFVYSVNSESVPVYEKTFETSNVITYLKKGEVLDIITTTDYGRFFKVKLSPDGSGFVLKTSGLRRE